MILVYINTLNGIGKSSYEAVTYAKKMGDSVVVLTNGNEEESNLSSLGDYGAEKVMIHREITSFESGQICDLISKVAEQHGINTIVFSHDHVSKAVAPMLSTRLSAGLVPGAISLPDSNGHIDVNVFSGKAIAKVSINSDKKIISLLPNSIPLEKNETTCVVEDLSLDLCEAKIKLLSKKELEGDIPLPEAELVVSAGRGLKGPENWGMVEDLAKTMGAATACSRPVSDIGWRPHHEHVGQTGIAIRPNLYIAAGISGAIQHLAGVNGSKVIVVINTDPEAPFFKAADYGIIGDAFEVLPKLNESMKKFMAQNN
ncbi:MAG: electron transfer flavoprotein subunit alpha/FixB family protein [Crocinitomicaceae bacterium]|nr:electron transfer flavoprotein subunit alpha/FixB family protein [Crocinitomicaceae bacterium]